MSPSIEDKTFITTRASLIHIICWVLGAFLFGEGIYDFLFVPQSDLYQAPLWVKISVTVVPCLFMLIAIFLFLLKKIKFSSTNVNICENKNKFLDVTWNDIASIKLLLIVGSPVYKLQLKNNKIYFFRAPIDNYFHFLGFTKDFSEFGNYIKTKQEEYNIC